jgi:dTMP kinase
MFLVFDGPDGSGKTTLATAVANTLAAEGHSVCSTREPYLPLTRAWLFDERVTARELAIAFAHDRHRHLHEVVRPALAAGQVVICDRYMLSTLIYQSQHVDPRFVEDLVEGTQEPDLTIIVEAPTEVCMGRQAAAGKTLDRFEARASLQENVRLKYLHFALAFGYPVVDGSGSPETTMEQAMQIVRPHLAGRAGQ